MKTYLFDFSSCSQTFFHTTTWILLDNPTKSPILGDQVRYSGTVFDMAGGRTVSDDHTVTLFGLKHAIMLRFFSFKHVHELNQQTEPCAA